MPDKQRHKVFELNKISREVSISLEFYQFTYDQYINKIVIFMFLNVNDGQKLL